MSNLVLSAVWLFDGWLWWHLGYSMAAGGCSGMGTLYFVLFVMARRREGEA